MYLRSINTFCCCWDSSKQSMFGISWLLMTSGIWLFCYFEGGNIRQPFTYEFWFCHKGKYQSMLRCCIKHYWPPNGFGTWDHTNSLRSTVTARMLVFYYFVCTPKWLMITKIDLCACIWDGMVEGCHHNIQHHFSHKQKMHLLIGIFSKFHVALLWLMLCFADWPMGVEAKLQRAFKY